MTTIFSPPMDSTQIDKVNINSPLSPAETKRAKELVGTFLYYTMLVDMTMKTAVGSIASKIV